MKQFYFLAAAVLFLTADSSAQTVRHYWNFDGPSPMDDVVGGLVTTAVGTPDMSVHATYGQAYPGANASLNIIRSGIASPGGGFLTADVYDEGLALASAFDFGTSNFSVSYWSYDDSADTDSRGPRICDCQAGGIVGQQASTAGDIQNWGLRDDLGGIGSQIPSGISIIQPKDAWVHVAYTIDRTNSRMEVFWDGVSQGIGIMGLNPAGNIRPNQDLEIGVINGGNQPAEAQDSGLDDLAWYDGLLSTADIVGLANGTLTPLSFAGQGGYTSTCDGDGGNQMGCTNCPCTNNAPAGTSGGCLNSAGTSANLVPSGSASISLPSGDTSDLRFELHGAPPGAFCILNSGDALAPGNLANPCFGMGSGAQAAVFDGLRCAITNTRRHGGRSADANGNAGVTNSPWGGEGGPPVGIGNAGAGFSAGQTRYFQVINRDDPLFVCMRGLNTSQAIKVTFTP